MDHPQFFKPFLAFSRIDCGCANQESENPRSFVHHLILGSWQLHKHSEVSQTSVSCSLQFHYCCLLISIWYLWMFGKDEEQDETNQVPRATKKSPSRSPLSITSPGKTIEITTRYLKSSPLETEENNWDLEETTKSEDQHTSTVNKSWLKVEETTNCHHQSVRFLPHGHHLSGWSVSFNRLTACVGDPVMGKTDSGEGNTPIRKGW